MSLPNLWGDLRPIVEYILLDACVLLVASYVACQQQQKLEDYRNCVTVLVLAASVTIAVAGNFTSRWTLTFPMAPCFVLQALRGFFLSPSGNDPKTDKSSRDSRSHYWIRAFIFTVTVILIFLSAALCWMFPVVELPPTAQRGDKYPVGIIDVFLPAPFDFQTSVQGARDILPTHQDYVSVRLLYPAATETSGSIPHLRPKLVYTFCREMMLAGAPPPLKPFGWINHYWRLATLKAIWMAPPAESNDRGMPIIIFSHGLGGTADSYSFQTRALAARGYLVVVLDHSDGSATVSPRQDGSFLVRNDTSLDDIEKRDTQAFENARRAMTEYRTKEFIATVQAVKDLNSANLPMLEQMNISFVNRLDSNEIHYMGHSFGGVTALHAAHVSDSNGLPQPTSVLAYEPALGWLPKPSLASILDPQRLEGKAEVVEVSSASWVDPSYDPSADPHSPLHEQNLLILFSHEWKKKNWGASDAFMDMQARGTFGDSRGNKVARVAVIDSAHHNEFSDISMLTPTWLARVSGITGQKSPIETAQDIHNMTLAFLLEVQERTFSN